VGRVDMNVGYFCVTVVGVKGQAPESNELCHIVIFQFLMSKAQLHILIWFKYDIICVRKLLRLKEILYGQINYSYKIFVKKKVYKAMGV